MPEPIQCRGDILTITVVVRITVILYIDYRKKKWMSLSEITFGIIIDVKDEMLFKTFGINLMAFARSIWMVLR